MTQIAVTGMGCVTAYGEGVQPLRDGIRRGRTAIRPLSFDSDIDVDVSAGGKLSEFDPGTYIDAMRMRRMDDVSRMAIVSSYLALEDAGIAADEIGQDERDEWGVVMGTSFAAASNTDEFFCGIVTKGPSKANPSLFPNTVPNAPASLVAIEHGLRGPNTTFCHLDTAADEALCYGADLLRKGRAELVLVGGVEELSPVVAHSMSAVGALASDTDPNEPQLRPFDRTRAGTILGEGAAILVLERLEDATRRGATVRGLLAGCGAGSVPVGPTDFDPEGRALEQAIQQCLRDASTDVAEFVKRGWVAASANGGLKLDRDESTGLRRCFGSMASSLAVSAPRSLTGSFHAHGAVKACIALLSIEQDLIPPSVGLREVADECSGLDHVMGATRRGPADWVLLTSIAAGGSARATMIRRHA